MVHGGCWVVCDMSFSFCWWMAPVQVWWELHRMASCVTRLCWLGKPSRCSGWSKKNVKEPSTKNNRACYWVRVDVAWTCASSKWGILFLQAFFLFLKVAPNSKRNIFGEVAKMLANNKRRCVYVYVMILLMERIRRSPAEVGSLSTNIFTRFEHHPTGGWPWDFWTINRKQPQNPSLSARIASWMHPKSFLLVEPFLIPRCLVTNEKHRQIWRVRNISFIVNLW